MDYGLLDEEEKKLPLYEFEDTVITGSPIQKNEVRVQPAEKSQSEMVRDYIKEKYELDKKELEDAKDEARQKRMGVGIFDAISTGLQSITGAKAPSYENQYAAANQGVVDVKEKQANWKRDPNDPRNVAFRQSLVKTPSALKRLQEMGFDPSRSSATIAEFEEGKPVYDLVGSQIKSDNDKLFQMQLAGLNQRKELDKEARAKAEDVAKATVPGYEIQPGARPTASDAKDLKEAALAKQDIENGLQELERLYNEHGTELGGVAADDMASIANSLKINYNKLANLGALSGADLAIIEGVIPDPSSMSANLKSLAGMDSTVAKIKRLREESDRRLKAREKTLGYQPMQKLPEQNDSVKVISPDGKVGSIPRANLQKALDRGFKVAE